MLITKGAQQGDRWLLNRCGRFTGIGTVHLCNYSKVNRGGKGIGATTEAREKYKYEIIAARCTGRSKEHYNSFAMQRGTMLEEQARTAYETIHRVSVQTVNFIRHPEFDFWGASPDGIIGREGLCEIKALLPWNHIEVDDTKEIKPERFAQVGTQFAVAGKSFRWASLFHWCPDLVNAKELMASDFRIGRDELEWEIPIVRPAEEGPKKRKKKGEPPEEKTIKLTGEAVIDYFTSEVIKAENEVQEYFMRKLGRTLGPPHPVEIIEYGYGVDELAGVKQLPASDDGPLSGPAYIDSLADIVDGPATLLDAI